MICGSGNEIEIRWKWGGNKVEMRWKWGESEDELSCRVHVHSISSKSVFWVLGLVFFKAMRVFQDEPRKVQENGFEIDINTRVS